MYNTIQIKEIYNRLKSSAKRRGKNAKHSIEFDLSLSDLNNITFPISCPILGIPLKFNRGKVEDNSISFDRIDSEKGYTIDNLVIISHRANFLKNNGTLDEMSRLADFYDSLKKNT